MKNFEFEHNGKKYWYSRSIAVAGFVFTKIDNKYHILINQRGEGSPDFIGEWNCPCGYMDFNETCEDAVSREVYEETGFKVPTHNWNLFKVNSNRVGSQNVTLLYVVEVDSEDINVDTLKQTGGELNEVSDIKLIPIDSLSEYSFAFNHKIRIEEALDSLLTNKFIFND